MSPDVSAADQNMIRSRVQSARPRRFGEMHASVQQSRPPQATAPRLGDGDKKTVDLLQGELPWRPPETASFWWKKVENGSWALECSVLARTWPRCGVPQVTFKQKAGRMLPWRRTMLACLFERNTIASPHLPRVGLHMGSVRDRDLDPPNQGPACPRGHLTPVHPRRGPWLISRRRSATTKRPGLLPSMSHCSESRHLGSVFFFPTRL